MEEVIPMWIDNEGTINVNIVAEPEKWIGPRLLNAIRLASNRKRNILFVEIEKYSESFSDTLDDSLRDVGSDPELFLPKDIVIESKVGGDLRSMAFSALDNVPWEWRLDAILALQHYLL